MATTRMNCFLRQLRQRMAAESLADQADSQLVERLIAGEFRRPALFRA